MANEQLADDMANPPVHGNFKTVCKVIEALDALGPEDRAVVAKAIDNPRWAASALATALQKHAVWIYAPTLTRHRGGRCVCYRAKDDA